MTESNERAGRVDCGDCPSLAGCNAGYCVRAELARQDANHESARAAAPQAESNERKPKPDAGHPLLQTLIDSIKIIDKRACWNYGAMYDVRDALDGAAAPQAQPAPAGQGLTVYQQAREAWPDIWLGNDRAQKSPREWFLIGVEWLHTGAARPSEPAPISDERIVEIWQGMPDGYEGFLKEWGYLQFARALLAEKGTST